VSGQFDPEWVVALVGREPSRCQEGFCLAQGTIGSSHEAGQGTWFAVTCPLHWAASGSWNGGFVDAVWFDGSWHSWIVDDDRWPVAPGSPVAGWDDIEGDSIIRDMMVLQADSLGYELPQRATWETQWQRLYLDGLAGTRPYWNAYKAWLWMTWCLFDGTPPSQFVGRPNSRSLARPEWLINHRGPRC
jgi:hypothetical protein